MTPASTRMPPPHGCALNPGRWSLGSPAHCTAANMEAQWQGLAWSPGTLLPPPRVLQVSAETSLRCALSDPLCLRPAPPAAAPLPSPVIISVPGTHGGTPVWGRATECVAVTRLCLAGAWWSNWEPQGAGVALSAHPPQVSLTPMRALTVALMFPPGRLHRVPSVGMRAVPQARRAVQVCGGDISVG